MMDSLALRGVMDTLIGTDHDWPGIIDRVWEETADALTSNYEATRQFLLEDCTAEDIIMVSEVYEEIFERAPEQRYAELLRQSLDRVPDENQRAHTRRILERIVDMYVHQ